MARKEWGARKPYTGPVRADIWLGCKSPRGDLDNYVKALLDGIQGIIIANDKQVKELHAYLTKRVLLAPYARVEIREIPRPEAS